MQKQFLIQRMRGFVFIVMIANPFFLIAQSKVDKNVALHAEADTLLAREDYAGALVVLNKIIDKSKLTTDADYQVLYKRAFCYYGLEEFGDALRDVNRYIEKVPDDQGKLLRIYINQELENYDDLLKDLNEFIASNPGNPELLRWRASIFMESERYAEAQKDIRLLLAYQSSPELKAYLGLAYYYQENADSALVIFDEVIAENPEYFETYLYASSLALEQGANALALQYIEAGFKIDSTNLTLLFYKGVALVDDEKIDEGCRCLVKAFERGMDDAGDYLKGYCYGAD